jgi:hypothetical protein
MCGWYRVSNLNHRRRRIWLLTVIRNSSRNLFYLEQEESESGGVKLLYALPTYTVDRSYKPWEFLKAE